jgi:hypothetical protein
MIRIPNTFLYHTSPTPCREFDVLYVVDPGRAWYDLGDEAGGAYYSDRLRQYTERYDHVIMVGDSMGATAALAFSEQATAVLAFCPQVRFLDLTSSIPCWLLVPGGML